MKIDTLTLQYLSSNETISNGHFFKTGRNKLRERNNLLRDLARNRKCVHIGCADHIELIHKKRTKGNYLHDILTKSASSLIGIDTNEEAIIEMNRASITNVYTSGNAPTFENTEVVFVPDVIEHIDNVDGFLQQIKKFEAKTYVFTTPNAFRLQNRTLFTGELVNTDHRCWYSPYTLAKTLSKAGYTIEQVWYTDKLKVTQPIRNILKLLFPICRDGICITAKPK